MFRACAFSSTIKPMRTKVIQVHASFSQVIVLPILDGRGSGGISRRKEKGQAKAGTGVHVQGFGWPMAAWWSWVRILRRRRERSGQMMS